MIKIVLGVLVLILGFNGLVNAQDSTLVVPSASIITPPPPPVFKKASPYKPVKGNFGVSFLMNTNLLNFQLKAIKDDLNNNTLFGRYYLTDDIAIRLGVGLTTNRYKNTKVDSLGTTLVQIDSTYSRSDFYFAPGIEKHFYSTDRLDPYAGLNLKIGSVGKAKSKYLKSITDTSGTASGTSTTQIDQTQSGGLQFGINLLLGFNYFIAKNMSIGASYSLGYNVLKTGGETALVYTNTPVNVDPIITREEFVQETSLASFGVNSSIGLSFSYFFGQQK